MFRADSALYTHDVIAAARRAKVPLSITAAPANLCCTYPNVGRGSRPGNSSATSPWAPTTACDSLTIPAHQPQPGTRSGRAGQTSGSPTPNTLTKINKPPRTSHNHGPG